MLDISPIDQPKKDIALAAKNRARATMQSIKYRDGDKNSPSAHKERPARGKPAACQEPIALDQVPTRNNLNIQGTEVHQCRDERPCMSHARLRNPPKHHLTTSQETANEHPFYFEEVAQPCKRRAPNEA
jgi:hypothetical protein